MGVRPSEESAAAWRGGSKIRKACLRSQKAMAALQMPLSLTPGSTIKLKIGTLSSDVSCPKAPVKSAAENDVAKPPRLSVNGWRLAPLNPAPYAPPEGATVTRLERPLRRLSRK